MLRRVLTTVLAFGLVALAASPALARAKELPVSAFIRHPAARQVIISPNGTYLAIVAAVKDSERYQLVIVTTKSVAAGKPHVTGQLRVAGHERFGGVYWINNKRLIASTTTKRGGFNRPGLTGKLYAINADGSHNRQILGHGAGLYFGGLISLLPKNPRAILVEGLHPGNNKATAYWLDVYTGKRHHVATSPTAKGSLIADHNGDVRIATGVNTLTGWPELYYRDAGSMDWQNEEKLIGKSAAAAAFSGGPIMFTRNNKKVYFDYTVDNAAETTGLFTYNLTTGKKKLLYANPTVDVGSFIISFDRKSIVGIRIEPGKPEIMALDPKAPRIQLLAALRQALPNAQTTITSWTRDGSEAVVEAWGATVSPTFYLYSAKPKPKLTFLLKEVPWISSDDLSPMKPISFKSRDGLTIHGYITLPRGKKPKDLPMVVYVHGGPHGIRITWGYSPGEFDSNAEQILANHGYAVLSLNYRGSGGYGFKFLKAGFHHWGDTMQNDLADGVAWAVKQGYANPQRVCIFGGSYGGYAALMNPERFPNLYKCAVGYDGCYDLALHETRSSDTARAASGRLYMKTVLGHNEKQLRAFSPADHADKLKIPVFLLHGGRDVRCPYAGFKEMAAAIRKHGTPLKTLVEPNEGHGFFTVPHREKAWKEILAFIGKYIGPGTAVQTTAGK